MKKVYIAIALMALIATSLMSCAEVPGTPVTPTTPAPVTTPTTSPTAQQTAFNFLISDAPNDINDFEHLYVTISGIGLHQGGENGTWIQVSPTLPEVDLKLLQGENATVIWTGNVTNGQYDKVFIYVSNVRGILVGAGANQTAEVKLPSNKLQISKPFDVSGTALSFVYDITVVKTGNGTYILKPQIAESGTDKPIKEVKQERSRNELQIQIEGVISPGATVTVIVTDNGSPVNGATITVSGNNTGTTGADGRLTITLPNRPGEINIRATFQNKNGELETEIEQSAQAANQWYEGTITTITTGQPNSSPWTMTLSGVQGAVTVNVAQLEGTPAVGARVQIEGTLTGNAIQNAQAEIIGDKGPKNDQGKNK